MNLLRVLSRELASKQLLRQGDSLKTTMLHFVELARCSASGATNSSSIRRVISSRTRRNTASFFSRVPGAAAGSSNPQCKNLYVRGKMGQCSLALLQTVMMYGMDLPRKITTYFD